jgi:cholesterol transport system auxiliary component
MKGHVKYIAVCIICIFVAGCLARTKPPYLVEEYIFEYDLPEVKLDLPSDFAVKICRFSVAQSFNSKAMVFKPSPHRVSTYTYHRWRVNPADMVTDFIVRDFKGLDGIKAVFSYKDIESARYMIEGGIEEFLQAKIDSQWKAILTVNITLIDSSKKEIQDRVVFQKRYRFQHILEEETPEGLAKGMSMNMRHLSLTLIEDISRVVLER